MTLKKLYTNRDKLRFKHINKPLKAKGDFDIKIAKSFMKLDYYKAQAQNIKMYEFLEKEKIRLSTPRWSKVTELLEKYKNMGLDGKESSVGKTLLGIFNRNKDGIRNGQLIRNTNLLNIISKPETLILAYRMIRGNKGAMTKAGRVSLEKLNSFTKEQRELYFRSQTFPDRISLQDFFVTSKLIQKGLYPWGSSRRIYVPKPGVKDAQRPITIPPFMDRVVQRAISMVLEAIYEPEFESINRSFGFRPNKGVHDAMAAISSRYTNGMRTAIEGDIKAAFDSVNKEKLVEILSHKIEDRKFLNLIRNRLNYEYTEKIGFQKTERVRPTLGVQQGGIDSPYLYNIYMNELDKFVQTELKNMVDNLNSKYKNIRKFNRNFTIVRSEINKEKRNMNNLKKLICEARDKGDLVLIQQLRKDLFRSIRRNRTLKHRKNRTSSSDNSRRELRFFYVRYADDWILLTNGNKEIAIWMKQKINSFLKEKLALTLSQEKTLITDITKEPAKFLGYEIRISSQGALYRKEEMLSEKNMKKANLQKKSGLLIWLAPDRQRLISRMFMKGFCDRRGFPKEIFWISTLEPQIIVERFNACIRGLAEYYIGSIRNTSKIHRWIYILRFSCLKTLAQKYRTTIKGIFKRFGHNLHSKSTQTIKIKVRLKIKKEIFEKSWALLTYTDLTKIIDAKKRRMESIKSFFETEKGNFGRYPLKSGRVAAVTNEDFLETISWTSLRTEASLGMPCVNCGSLDNVQMHHLRHARKIPYSTIPETQTFKQILALRNRKQAPLCEECHKKGVHSGTYVGQRLISISPRKTMVDNRIIHVESFIKPGVEYTSAPLEERGWEKLESKNYNHIPQGFRNVFA